MKKKLFTTILSTLLLFSPLAAHANDMTVTIPVKLCNGNADKVCPYHNIDLTYKVVNKYHNKNSIKSLLNIYSHEGIPSITNKNAFNLTDIQKSLHNTIQPKLKYIESSMKESVFKTYYIKVNIKGF